ncbi:MAG: hypothetical protein ACT4PM_13510 [Gemmatimonadales bacterium]
MTQRDVVLRWIEQIARVIRRMLAGPGPQDVEAARLHLEEAMAQHLGSLAEVVPRLDVTSAANLLRDPDRILGLALLLDLLASVQEAAGEQEASALTRGRAEAFRRTVAPG